MADLLIIGTMIAFIVLCVAYVAWCDRIIGPAEDGASTALRHDGTSGTGE